MSQQPKAKMNIPMCAACVLLCLTLFSMHLTGGLYAKYTAKGNGEDDARVAKFDVRVTKSADAMINISTSAKDGIYSFVVTNESEVAVKYDLTLTFEEDVHKFLKVTLGENTKEISGRTVTFTDVESLAPSKTGATQNLTFTVYDDSSFASKADGGNYSEDFAFTAVVNCEQID